jgi:hypothetical protein
MTGGLREWLNKPWLGWVLFVIVLGLAVYFFLTGGRSNSPYSPDRMKETVTIRFTDTNDEIEMTRGQLDKEVRRRGEAIDPTQGIINPKTGQPTGFLFSKSEWEEMVKRINAEKAAIRASAGKSVAPAPRPETPVDEETLRKLGEPPAEKK